MDKPIDAEEVEWDWQRHSDNDYYAATVNEYYIFIHQTIIGSWEYIICYDNKRTSGDKLESGHAPSVDLAKSTAIYVINNATWNN